MNSRQLLGVTGVLRLLLPDVLSLPSPSRQGWVSCVGSLCYYCNKSPSSVQSSACRSETSQQPPLSLGLLGFETIRTLFCSVALITDNQPWIQHLWNNCPPINDEQCFDGGFFFSLHIIMWVGFLCYDQEKVSWLAVVCLADSDWSSAEALGCSQSSCLCINPRHTLQLWPHWASIAAVIQLPGRETCTASQADNNQLGLENSGLLPRCQQSMFLCLLAGHRAAGGPSVVSSRQQVIFRHHFSVIIVNNFGSAHGYLKETLSAKEYFR